MPRSTVNGVTGRVTMASAATRSPNPREAVRELASALGPDAALYLVFVAVPYPLDELAVQLRSVWDQRVIGCTCARFFGAPSTGQDTVMAVALSGDLSAETIPIEPLDDLTTGLGWAGPKLSAVRESVETAPEELDAFALLLVDGLSRQEEHLAAELFDALGGMVVVGGSASDDLRFERTAVLSGDRFIDNAATCTVVRTRAPFVPFRFQHYCPGDEILVVTRATPDQRLVHEINGLPASQAYASAIGVGVDDLTTEVIATHPVTLSGGGVAWVRAISEVMPDGTLAFFSALDSGSVLRLAVPTSPAQSLREGFSGLRRRIGEIEGTLAFDCLLRHIEFQRNGLGEEIAGELNRHHVVGFSSFGEQYEGMHVNQTIVGIAFGRGQQEIPDSVSETSG